MTHAWWYLARSSGLVAWALLATAVFAGLLLSTRVFDRRPSPKWFTDLHRFLGGTAVIFTGIHVAMLVGDSYVHFGTKEVLVPLASNWRPVAVACGVISLWIMVAVEGTSLMMRYLPRRIWHGVHLSSFGLFVTATLHAMTDGTDTRNVVFVMGCTALLAVVLLLTLIRLAVPRERSVAARRAVDRVRLGTLAEVEPETQPLHSVPGDGRAL